MNLSQLKGIGPQTQAKLEKLGIFSLETLLTHYPTRYVDRTKRLKLIDLPLVTTDEYHCIAKIVQLKKLFLRGGKNLVTAKFADDTSVMSVTWFNNPYITSSYEENDIIVFSGSVAKGKLVNPILKKLDHDVNASDFDSYEEAEEVVSFARIEPVYRETSGLKSNALSKFLAEAIALIPSLKLKETLPKTILKSEKFMDLATAYRFIHFPTNKEQILNTRKRFAFEELYEILKKVQKVKKARADKKSHALKVNLTAHEILLEKFPFQLTSSQEEVIQEIFADLQKSTPSNRLINGDVGSGKTIIAASALWQTINNGLQSVFLAPTGVLATQQYEFLKALFGDTVQVHLITTDSKNNIDLASLTKELSTDKDQNDVFVGTHALFYNLELFQNLGVIVVDEQHKFGVEQREILSKYSYSKSQYVPHLISMTATPIPRSLALSLFGDLDVSFLATKPLNRKPIITKLLLDEEKLDKMYLWVREQIEQKYAQVYVVCPLIEDSERSDMASAKKIYSQLVERYKGLTVGLLHGKLKAKEKDALLNDFKANRIQILVSTSVIEVGIDNPNATIMLIESAERFGLAQLHQIRGRVGRSELQSYCFLKSTNNQESERLEFFAQTDNGFDIAEYDLKQRGPGEVYGNIQSGIPNLKIANILDLELIKRVKKYLK